MSRNRKLTGLLVGATLLFAACSSGASGDLASNAAPAATSVSGKATAPTVGAPQPTTGGYSY